VISGLGYLLAPINVLRAGCGGVALRRSIAALGIRVIDTFDADSRQVRRKKMAFRNGDGRVKITTAASSYKGWDTRAMILQVGHARSQRDHALFYTGLTRLRVSRPKSYLTIVISAQEYSSWGASSWSRT